MPAATQGPSCCQAQAAAAHRCPAGMTPLLTFILFPFPISSWPPADQRGGADRRGPSGQNPAQRRRGHGRHAA